MAALRRRHRSRFGSERSAKTRHLLGDNGSQPER
jgi:hypothetical protein